MIIHIILWLYYHTTWSRIHGTWTQVLSYNKVLSSTWASTFLHHINQL